MYALPGGFLIQAINWYRNRKLSKARQGTDIDAAYLDNITLGRIQGEWLTDSRVKDACCATAEEIGRQEQGGEVTGETVGKWSRSYATSGESAAARLYDTAVWYLAVTGLLYRGMR